MVCLKIGIVDPPSQVVSTLQTKWFWLLLARQEELQVESLADQAPYSVEAGPGNAAGRGPEHSPGLLGPDFRPLRGVTPPSFLVFTGGNRIFVRCVSGGCEMDFATIICPLVYVSGLGGPQL